MFAADECRRVARLNEQPIQHLYYLIADLLERVDALKFRVKELEALQDE